MMVLFDTICGGALSPVEAIVGTPRGKAEGDLSRQANEKRGSFALLLAAEKGHEAVVRVLLEAGADAKQGSSAECRGAELGGFGGVVVFCTCHGVGARKLNLKGSWVPCWAFETRSAEDPW